MAMKSSRSGSRQHPQQQQQQQQLSHSRRVKHRDDDDDDEELDEKSQDSIDAPSDPRSPHCLSRDEVLSSLGYRSVKMPQPATTPKQADRSNTCRRCGKKVYPLELIDIGDCYHRGCFKCYVSTAISCFVHTCI